MGNRGVLTPNADKLSVGLNPKTGGIRVHRKRFMTRIVLWQAGLKDSHLPCIPECFLQQKIVM